MIVTYTVSRLLCRVLVSQSQPQRCFTPSFQVSRLMSGQRVPISPHTTAIEKYEAKDFMALFPKLVKVLTDSENCPEAEAAKWFAKVLQYNVPEGKISRGLAVVMTYRNLMKSNITPDDVHLAHVLGWCVKMLHARMLIDDDIMDEAVTRRNRPCWYRTNNLGGKAVNDSMYLEAAVHQLLRKYAREKPYYIDLVEVFHEATLKTAIGQCLDVHCLTEDKRPDLDKFTMDRYNAIAKNKTAFYAFYLPIALGMHMAGITDPELHNQAERVFLEIGSFFQVQDDFLDCFGHPEVTGKVGTDIEDGKCSWLVVSALQRGNEQQNTVIRDCYGYHDAEKVLTIKKLYEELEIPAAFKKFEEESFNQISTHIKQISPELPRDFFFNQMNKIYRRDK